MRWIKYQIVQSENDEGFVLVDKKIGYSEENLAIAESEAYGDVTIVNDSKMVIVNKVLDKTGFASGMHNEAGWRSIATGYMSKADNTSFAAGRLAEATGKCSFASGIETYTETSVVTVSNFSIDAVDIYVSNEVTSELNIGDYICITPEIGETSDCKRIVNIVAPEKGWGYYKIVIDSPLRAENYYEGHNAPGDGFIPSGSIIKKAQITKATGAGAHAQGAAVEASGAHAHAKGYKTAASGDYSTAEGQLTKATGRWSHAQGKEAVASGDYSRAGGYKSEAKGTCSSAFGSNSKASGEYASADGLYAVASSKAQHVQGKYNVEDAAGKYAHIVGNGTSASKRSNCHTVDWEGNAWYSGSVSATKGIVVPYGYSLDDAPTDVPDGTLFVLITE